MAISKKMLIDIAKLVKLGSTLTYVERNNQKDNKTFTDVYNEFEKGINDKKELVNILNAIYDVSDDNRINKSLVVSTSGSKYMVTDTKDAKTGEIKILQTKTIFRVSDDITRTKTTVELKGIIEQKKAAIVPLRKQLELGLKTAKNDADIIELMEHLLDTK